MMKGLRTAIPITCLGMLLYLCTYKVGNTDFWWHVKAGQILRESGWITTDPFAYTRIGEPYLANHEWLAQVALSLVYDVMGAPAIIIMRMVMVAVTFGVFLFLDRPRVWINSTLSLLAAILARPALTDRPQLFTFLLFSIILYSCLAYLEAEKSKKNVIRISLPLLCILWSNLHGAAGIVGIALLGALGIQRIADHADRSEIYALLCTGVLSILALVITPNGIENVTYIATLMSDQTTDLIAEWQSVSWITYMKRTGILWILSLLAVWQGRRHMVFSILVLLGIGYLSKSAVRHEVLFLIAALGICVHQRLVLRCNTKYIGVGIATLLLGFATVVQSARFTMPDNLFGFGEFTPMRGSSEFIHREGISGNMFNNYNAGGELLYRDHSVFLDGRNLDYGFAYMNRAVQAGTDSVLWNQLTEDYDITHAVVYYELEADRDPIPYIDVLQRSSDWGLVYLDDWAAVYTKGRDDAITQITPAMLHRTTMPEEITLGNLQVLQREVLDIAKQNPRSIKGPTYHKAMLEAFGNR